MNYLTARMGEPSTYIGLALMFLIGGGVDFATLTAVPWTDWLGMAASLTATLMKERG